MYRTSKVLRVFFPPREIKMCLSFHGDDFFSPLKVYVTYSSILRAFFPTYASFGLKAQWCHLLTQCSGPSFGPDCSEATG